MLEKQLDKMFPYGYNFVKTMRHVMHAYLSCTGVFLTDSFFIINVC